MSRNSYLATMILMFIILMSAMAGLVGFLHSWWSGIINIVTIAGGFGLGVLTRHWIERGR